MKRFLLLFGCSLLVMNAPSSVMADAQLKAVKDLYLKEFQNIDADKDGVISEQEYLTYQFNALRADMANADGFGESNNASSMEGSVSATASAEPTGIPAALSDMANYELDGNLGTDSAPVKLTKEDVMPEPKASTDDGDMITEPEDELDLSISEEETLQRLIDAGTTGNVTPETNMSAEETAETSQDSQISVMLDTIKKTLPKKIDEITTWVDITYDNNVIDYVYQADIDMATYNDDELNMLKENIQDEACTKAYTDMCPRIKPMFIDRGIDMRIVYLDKNKESISSCEFNKSTCGE